LCSLYRAIITRAPFLLPFALRAELFQDMCRVLPDSDDDEHNFFQMRRLSIYRSRLFDMGLQAVSEHSRALRQGENQHASCHPAMFVIHQS
jgi:hypothetical protein